MISAIGDPPAVLPLETPRPVAKGAARPPNAAAPEPWLWRVYSIHRLTDGRGYVGVTRRSLATRLAMHDHLARRRPDLGGPGTLAEAIRGAYSDGIPFPAAFRVAILAVASTPDAARDLERRWIAALGTALPHGFNVMPGGASLGGPANVIPVVIDHPTRGTLRYGSVMDAVADIDRERKDRGLPPLRLGSIYARRVMNWPIEEALGLADHADGRRRRAAFRWNDRGYHNLRDLAKAEGTPIDTIRSKLYRARRAGCHADHDMARDRRRPGGHRTGGAGHGRLPPLCLPHPRDRNSAPVDAGTFARLSGVPKATVLYRYHRFVQARGSAAWTRREMLATLTRHVDRTVPITLLLATRRALSGGVREVIKAMQDDSDLEASRPERLGFSAIRARLRRVPGWPWCMNMAAVRWAFGFEPDAAPARARPGTTK
jgi:hypothetical protein